MSDLIWLARGASTLAICLSLYCLTRPRIPVAVLSEDALLAASRWDECDGEPKNAAAVELMRRWGEWE